MTRNGRFLGLLALVFLSSIAFSFSTRAGLSVGPLSVRMEIEPGGSETASLTLRNTGEEPTDVGISLHDWWRTPQGDLQILEAGSLERSCSSWLTFVPSYISLASGEEAEVSMSMAVPESTEDVDVSGDHWAILLIEEKPPLLGEEDRVEGLTGTTRVVVSYAIKILQQDPATTDRSARIDDIALEGQDPLSFTITYTNTGSAHLQTIGTAQLLDLTGEPVRQFTIPVFPALPGETRIVSLIDEGEETLAPGAYFISVVLDFGEEFLIQGGLPVVIE